jgi:cytidylate kinase
MPKNNFQIAIDGPVAAGKGIVSRLLAQKLGSFYVDTGAMYRTTALLAIKNDVDFSDEDKLVELIKNSKIEMRNPDGEKEADGRLITVLLNDEDVSWAIRTKACSDGSSKVSLHPKVREILVEKQQEIAANQDVVMEGRDITFRVLPNADLKIYMTADLKTRAERRQNQYLLKGDEREIEDVLKEVEERDYRDTHRETDPLHIVEDALVINSSNLEIEEVVDMIAEKAEELIKEKSNK